MEEIRRLEDALQKMGCRYRRNEPMGRHTSFRIGGPADLFITPSSPQQASDAMLLCHDRGIPCVFIGNGSNLLVADEGLRGAVIKFGPEMAEIRREGDGLWAQAGATLAQLCRRACEEGLAGLEFAWGIPGSVGGAIRMNAGAYGGEMKDCVSEVEAFDRGGKMCVFSGEQAGFSYRNSRFVSGETVCAARFSLKPGDPEAILRRMDEILRRRQEKQPLELPSAGSAFKRPPGHFAAALIDQCGLKGYSIGGAQVSAKHAGFLVNTGTATCRDVLLLLDHIRETVKRKKGICLETEIQILP